MSEEVAVYESRHDIAVARDPEQVLSEAQKAAKALTIVIAGKKKPFILNGEQYLEYEDWQTVAKFYGLCAKTHDAIPCEVDGIKGAKAEADVIDVRSGLIVGHAEAYCLRDEKQWIEKPFFQVASMAQTRAGAKAFRNVLAWVVVLAGYRPIPAEEMQDIGQKPPIQPPQSKSKKDSETHPQAKTTVEDPTHRGEVVSEAQRKRFYAIGKSTGATDDQIKDWLFREYAIEHTKDITGDLYDEICVRVKEELGGMREPGSDDA